MMVRKRLAEAATPALAGLSVLIASFGNFLSHNHYPLLTREAGLITVVIVGVATAMWLVYASAEKVSRGILQVLLVWLALDLNFDGLVVPVATAAIAIVFNRKMAQFVGIASVAALLTGLVGATAPAKRNAEEQSKPAAWTGLAPPILVHIILDEHIGIEGILGNAADDAKMRSDLKTFYLNNGFRLFGGAYSEYLHTVNAIPHVLNFGERQVRQADERKGSSVKKNAYFERLRAMGYSIHVFQTDYLDYCGSETVASCRTRPATKLGIIADALPLEDKALLLAKEFAKLAHFPRVGARVFDLGARRARKYGVPVPLINLETSFAPVALGAIDTFDRISNELATASAGEAYFVHELLPHYPYLLDDQCHPKGLTDWRNRQLDYSSKEERYHAYFAQVRCAMTQIGSVLQSLADKDAIVIVHGDHGSRITDVDPTSEAVGAFTDKDLIAGYSTLFAVRAAHIPGGYQSRSAPIYQLIESLAASAFSSVSLPSLHVPEVMLEDRRWMPAQKHPLPAWWPAAD